MTDKQSFLEKLTAALIRRNISEQDIAPYIEQFDRFYDRMVVDSNTSGGVLDDVETIADNIASQVSDRYDEINRLAERTMTVQTVSVDTEILDTAASEIISESSDELELVELPADIGADGETPEDDTGESNKLPEYVGKENIQDSKMFWILFAVSLPLTVPLAFFGLSLFVGVWAALAAVIVGVIAALIGVVTAGSAAALVGIIYGTTQLFVSFPEGLYEIGIGVVVVGITMFVGILLYNFAIRFIPLICKLVYRLFKFTLKKLKVLFNYLRRECAKL